MEIILKTTYKGGMYDQGLSEVYDGAKSLNGFARASSIVTHVFLNEEVIYKATALKGARIYRKASRKGSFVELFTVAFENPLISGAAGSAFYDLLKYSFNSAMGKATDPETPRIKKFVERKEPIISQLNESLEEPLKEMHRPINSNRGVTIDVSQAQKPLVRMDAQSYDYLYNDIITDLEDGVFGNVTKYNTLTGYGRVYLDRLGKTYSFKIDEHLSAIEKHLITWSIDDAYRVQGGGKLDLTIRAVETADGIVKRVIVFGVSKMPTATF